MTTEALATADFPPRQVERTFRFVVVELPGPRADSTRVDAVAEGDPETVYGLFFRRVPFSLQRVTRRRADGPEETLLENGPWPCVLYTRRLPLVPDFPALVGPSERPGRHDFTVRGQVVSQTIESTPEGWRITVETTDYGTTRVVTHWRTGQPWWSSIKREVLGPGDNPGGTVASGYLLEGAAPASP